MLHARQLVVGRLSLHDSPYQIVALDPTDGGKSKRQLHLPAPADDLEAHDQQGLPSCMQCVQGLPNRRPGDLISAVHAPSHEQQFG